MRVLCDVIAYILRRVGHPHMFDLASVERDCELPIGDDRPLRQANHALSDSVSCTSLKLGSFTGADGRANNTQLLRALENLEVP